MTARLHLLARCVTAGIAAASMLGALPTQARADSVIKRPGARPDYAVELEPHLVLALDGPVWADEGIGLGFRASIPIVDEPIKTINNNMAIGFGFDWAHHGDNNACWWRYRNVYYAYPDDNCNANSFYFPVVLQWNFWLTDIISVYGEPGLAIRYWRYEGPCNYADWDGICDYDDTDVLPIVFYGGARFMFSDSVGLNVRMGFWPTMLNVGASFLL
jgi:hypothetical protein